MAGNTVRVAACREAMVRRIVLCVLLVSMAGCVDRLAARQAQLNQLVGKPEVVLIQAMGVPTRTYEAGGVKFLAYDEQRLEILPGSPFYYGSGPYPGFYGGFPPQAITLVCNTTFSVVNGAVSGVVLRGNACG